MPLSLNGLVQSNSSWTKRQEVQEEEVQEEEAPATTTFVDCGLGPGPGSRGGD